MKPIKRNPRKTFVPLFLLLTTFIVGKTDAQYEERVIIVSGQEAYGTDGAVFASSIPGRRTSMPIPLAISKEGKVVFRARLEPGIGDATDDNQFGIWAKEKDDFTLLAREQSKVPGSPELIFTRLPEVFMDLEGQIGLDAICFPSGEDTILWGESEIHGFFVEENGDMVLIVHDGMTVVPSVPGVTLEGFEVAGFNRGRVIIRGWLEGEGIESDNNLIAAMVDESGFNILCREGDPMPFVAGDYVNEWVGFHTTLDMNGNTIVWIQGKDDSTNHKNEAVYYWEQPGGLSLIIDSDSPPPFPVFGTNNWRLNASGNVVNMGGIGDDYILSMKKKGDFLRVVSRGDVADGTNDATFTTFGRWIGFNHYHKCVLHDNNTVSVLAETSDRKTGIWMGDETGLKKVVYRGDQAPGLEDGLLFSEVWGMEANAAGQVAISIGAGGRDSEGNWVDFNGIWFGYSDGLELVLKTDDQFEIEPEVFKTIEHVSMTSLLTTPVDRPRTGADGWPTCVNDNGEILLALNFDDGENALVVASPTYPEIIVNSTDDDVDNNPGNGKCECDGPEIEGKPQCTLRAAIMEANEREGKDRITYNIPTTDSGYDSAAGTFTIQPETALPPCTESVDIIGNTVELPEPLTKMSHISSRQQEYPEVILDGRKLLGREHGLQFPEGIKKDSVINHTIIKFPGSGILIGRNNLIVQGCFIGTTPALERNLGNTGDGIQIQNASKVVIGGLTNDPGTSPGNVITCNRYGIVISGEGARDNKILGNVIGEKFAPLEYPIEDSTLGNKIGVFVDGPGNFIGGDKKEARNVISGNRQDGIQIVGANATGNHVEGNCIGTDFSGWYWIANVGAGVRIHDASGNTIGGETNKPGTPPGNLISGNGTGIVIEQQSGNARNNRIKGNLIGLTFPEVPFGDGIIENEIGVLINQADSTIVGGSDSKARNIISGNTQDGIQITGANATGNRVEGNYIGTDWTGSEAMGNDTTGVHILGASGNSIGGQSEKPGDPPGNLISGNGIGIVIEQQSGNTRNNLIEGNLIGTEVLCEAKLPNEIGVLINQADSTIVGGALFTARNIISGNTQDGIQITGENATDNHVVGNYIGTNWSGLKAIGNNTTGVCIRDASGNFIGGQSEKPGDPPGNIISGNGIGIVIEQQSGNTRNNRIEGNLIGITKYSVTELPNEIGVLINQADSTLVGGADSTARNIISGNTRDGIQITGAKATNNHVQGNYIGTDLTGSEAIRNKQTGVRIFEASGNSIGERSTKPGVPPGNVISANINNIYIYGAGADSNRVLGNIIGLDKDGKKSVQRSQSPQEYGVVLDDVSGNIIGDSTATGRNVISGNWNVNVIISGGDSKQNKVWGNFIGLAANGTDSPAGHTYSGIKIGWGATENDIGNLSVEPGIPPGNVISGNEVGILIDGTYNRVRGNFIGPDSSGAWLEVLEGDDAFFGNLIAGIAITGSRNIVGGTNSLARNVISGNITDGRERGEGGGVGILIYGDNNKVFGNFIGVAPDGTTKLANTAGIHVYYRNSENIIGSPVSQPGIAPGNVIANSHDYGIKFSGQSYKNYLEGNLIGLNAEGEPSGNFTGVIVENSYRNILGGLEPGAQNIISGNFGNGIVIRGSISTMNSILRNHIGTDISGTENMANFEYGIYIRDHANHNKIGGLWAPIGDVWAPNRISYNEKAGVRLENSFRNEVISNSIHSNKTGVELSVSITDVITNNEIWYNETGILVENYTYSFISGNDIKNGGGSATGIHLDNAWAEIYGNSITEDAGDGIAFENGADGSVYQNNIFNNQGFGLNNTDGSVMVVAQDNWWGNDTGPGGEGPGSGDEVSTGVDYANWRTEMVSLVVSTGFDTLYIPSAEIDSALVSFRNWQNPTETVEVSVTDDLGWVQEPTTFQVILEESFGGGASIQLAVPGDTEEGIADNVTVTAVSQTDPETSETDSFLVLVYGPVLTQIFVTPDSVILSPGDTVQFEVLGMDQFNLTLDFAPIWSATGGIIDETGLYTAGEEEGVYVVTATDESGEVQGHAHVEIQKSVGIEGDEEISDHKLPTEFHLSQNYPNPFNPVTTIEYALPEVSSVRLEIYNIIGQLVEVLIESNQAAGFHLIQWDASGLASGVYFYRLEADKFAATKKMLLLK